MPFSVINILGPIKVNSMAGSSSNLIGDANYVEINQFKEYRSAVINTGDLSPIIAPVTPIYNDPHIF